MTSRSTRNKLRWQTEKIDQHLVKCQEHLHFLSIIACDESDYIKKNMPVLVSLIEAMRSVNESFRQGL